MSKQRLHSERERGGASRIVLFANTDWYLYNFRRSLAIALSHAGYHVLLVSPPGRYTERFAAMGLRWRPLSISRRSLNPLRAVATIWRLWRLLRAERPDLVHGFTIKCAVYGAIAARLARVPARVSSVAGTGYVFASSDLRARALRPAVRFFLRLALAGRDDLLILQNSDDVALIERASIVEQSRIRLIRGSGVDCRTFVDRGPADAKRPLRVLFAGRLLWDKGLGEFVEAGRMLRREGRDLQFLIAGAPDAGNPAAVPESTVTDWHREGIVRWLGHVEDMHGLLQSADIVVLPSYREGIPKTLTEAAACALPIVTTDVPGCREVVTDGVDGLLVPVRDAGAVAAAIRRIDDDRRLARTLGVEARAKALRLFDERIIVEQTVSVYEELLPSAHRRDAFAWQTVSSE